MNKNILDKIFYGEQTIKNHKLNLKEVLIKYIATNSVQMYDRRILFGNKKTEKLKSMEFPETLQNLGFHLSIKGKDMALIAYKINGEDYIDYAEVASYVKIGQHLKEVMLKTEEEFIDNDGVKHPVYVYFRFSEGNVIKSDIYLLGEKIIDITPIISYNTNVIPVKIMKNNALGRPDLPEELNLLLNEYEFYGEQLGIEWEKVKTQFLNNMLFGSTKDGLEWQKDIESGKYVHDVSDDDGKLQGALGTMVSGSNTPTLVIQNIQFIEDKILKYSHQFRETNFSGTNKHNLEISQSNKQAFEYMMNKLEFRQRQLQSFFDIIGWKDVHVTIMPSEIEEAKANMMNAQVGNLNAQSNQYNAQAEASRANAKTLNKGAANVKPSN